MSGLAVTLLLVAGIACGVITATLLAMLKAAAHGDARVERDSSTLEPERPEPRAPYGQPATLERPTGRFARRGSRSPDSEDRPVAH